MGVIPSQSLRPTVSAGDPIAGAAVPGGRPGRGRNSRGATLGLTVVLLGVSGFGLWSSQSTSRSSEQALMATRLSNSFADAAKAVAAEESLERKYRLEPGPDVLARYEKAAGELVAALSVVRRDGDAADRGEVDRVLAAHDPYLASIRRMYAAVDRGNTAQVLKIDAEEVDPQFALIEQIVDDEALDHHNQALTALSALNELESFTARATAVVFLVGLVLVALFASVLRRVRSQLDVQHEQALYDSLHDGLTGLPNRTLLADRFAQALRAGRRDGTATGLLLIDLDRFKEINDTLGHHYGDLLLTQIGPRLTGALREVDTIARLGGDEFAVLLPGIDGVDGALLVAERLRAALAGSFAVDGIELDIEASIGLVLSGQHGEDAATLLQRADVAMYVAKEQSLGIFVYDPDTDGHSPERLTLLGDLRRGMDRGELLLHYQPKVSLSTGDVCGVEALIRWQHPDRGLVPPDQFIPLAEHTGLIGPLTAYVLDTALVQARTWADLGHQIPVSVNLSARNLIDERLVDTVTALLDKHGVSAHLLVLEVTESAIMIEPARARRLLTRLHDLGIKLSIDDFGAGYTSLAQLKNLPVTELKVDRSFVLTMDTDPANALIVRSVVELSHNLGLTAVAEGVETQQAMDTLTGYGCDSVQGYHLSRPLPAEAFLTWYTAHSPAAPAATATAAR
jgi:diguanylate cyclase